MSSSPSAATSRRSTPRRLFVPLVAAVALVLGPLAFAPAQALGTFAVSGTVTDESATPLEGVSVEIQEYNAQDDYFQSLDNTYTDVDGAFTFPAIDAGGTYRLRVEGTGGYVTQVGSPFVLNADRSVGAIALGLGGSMTGRVLEDGSGTPVEGAQVKAYPVTSTGVDEDNAVYTNADADGLFELAGLPAGAYQVRILDIYDAHVTEYYDDASSLADAATVDVTQGSSEALGDISLAVGAKFKGVIQDDIGGQVVDPAVFALKVLPDGSADYEHAYSATVDQVTGAYTVQGLPAGDYKISLSENSDAYFTQFYDGATTVETADAQTVALGDVKDLGTSVLERTASVTGTVEDGAGAPLSDIDVEAYRVVGGVASGTSDEYAYTDDNGEFRVNPLHAGTYRLVVQDGEHVYATKTLPDVTVTAGETLPVADVVLTKIPVKKTPTVKVTGVGGTGKATFTIKVTASGVTPTGKVTVKLGSRSLKTATLRSGKATITVTHQKKGKRTYTVSYSGDARVKSRTVTTSRITIK